MKLHVLKIKACYFYDVSKGLKKAELREDDRQYEVGDLIHFVDVKGHEIDYFENNLYEITHVLRNVEEYGLKFGYAILSIEKVK